MTRSVCLATFLIVVPVLAGAEQYWIAYEANDFPENEGWTRIDHGRPAERWLDEGSLVIDSRRDVGIYDYYRMYFDGTLDPGPAELFVMRWRLKVDEVDGFYGPTIGVTSNEVAPDEFYSAAFGFREDRVLSVFEQGVSATFAAGLFHDYRFQTRDMRSYQLYIDDELAIEGVFYEVFGPTRVAWGDTTSARSFARWDYVRFGVVPEPGSAILAVVGLFARRHAA